MEQEKQGVEAQPTPSALEGAVASSPEVQEEAKQQVLDTQSPPAEQGVSPEQEPQQEQQEVQEEEPRVPYSRLKEVVDEKNWFKSQLEQQIAQRQEQLRYQQPNQDPYAGMDNDTKIFWQGIDKRIEERATAIADKKIQSISPMLDAGARELAQMKVQQFRNNHPDVKPNSPEEMEIAKRITDASRIGFNLTPDEAYWGVMGPRGIRQEQQKAKQQYQKKIVAKKAANVETSASIPASVKPAPKLSFREEFAVNLEKMEKGTL